MPFVTKEFMKLMNLAIWKKTKSPPPSKYFSGINKIWYGTYFYIPRYPAGGGYIVCVRLSMSASLTTYAIPP
jgi:hypothetical protein